MVKFNGTIRVLYVTKDVTHFIGNFWIGSKQREIGINTGGFFMKISRFSFLSEVPDGAIITTFPGTLTEWQTYRQQLRDLPTHSNWPYLEPEDWPTKPS